MRARVAPLVVAAVTVLAFVGGACSSDDDDSADPTLPTQPAPPTTTTTTQPTDPYAIPEVIDEAYVNRVLAALDQIEGDVLRNAVADGAVGPEERRGMRAIYNDPQFEDEFASLVKVLPDKQSFQNPPGNRRRSVTRLVSVRANCIFLEATADFSQVLKAPSPDSEEEVRIFTLRPTQEGTDPGNVNPTPWSISNAEIVRAGYVIPDRARCDS